MLVIIRKIPNHSARAIQQGERLSAIVQASAKNSGQPSRRRWAITRPKSRRMSTHRHSTSRRQKPQRWISQRKIKFLHGTAEAGAGQIHCLGGRCIEQFDKLKITGRGGAGRRLGWGRIGRAVLNFRDNDILSRSGHGADGDGRGGQRRPHAGRWPEEAGLDGGTRGECERTGVDRSHDGWLWSGRPHAEAGCQGRTKEEIRIGGSFVQGHNREYIFPFAGVADGM